MSLFGRDSTPARRSFTTGVMEVREAAGGLGRPQRGNPRRGFPLYPLLRFFSDGVFRALRRAARAPPLDPARFFVKKRGKKLLDANLHPTQAPRRGGE